MTGDLILRVVTSDTMGALIDAFLDACALDNLSPRTLTNYRRTLGNYRWWCQETRVPLDPELHTKHHIREFLRYLQESEVRWGNETHPGAGRRLSPTSVQHYFQTLHRWYEWLVEDESIERSPMAAKSVRKPKARVEQPDPFTADELARIVAALDAAGENMLAVRDRAIVAMLLDIGLRRSEVAALTVQDVNVTTGDVIVRHGKGDKPRHLRMGARARRASRRYWLRYRSQQGPAGAFFLGRTGEPLTSNGVQQMMDRLRHASGVATCHAHKFRHTAAVNAIRAGMGLLQLQLMLGHSSLEMTRRYVKLVEQDAIRAGTEHSPLDYLKLSL